jgi:Domain of unknown function (DUF4190)/Protein of unknown function (DUF2510)
MSTSAPGWYPDPSRPGAMRWWDGSQWSDHSAPAPPPVYVGETDGYAIASLICGVLGVPIVSIVLGVMARNRIRDSGGLKTGNGLAIAGIVLGIVQLVIFVIVLIVIIAAAASTSSS